MATLAGARHDVLEAAPGARSRFVALGGVLLSTGGLAVLSAAFAVHMALGASWVVALLVGLGWGTVIVNLDRMLLVGMGHDASVRRNVALAVPRVGLALVLGVVIATPLTLQVFHREIDTQIVSLQAEASDAYKTSLDHDARFAGLPALQKRVAAEQAVVATGGQSDGSVGSLRADVTAKQAAYDAAVASWRDLQAKAQCELNGTCGTGRPGVGDAYDSAKAAADAQAAVVASARSALDAATAAVSGAQSRSASQAAGNLAADQAELARLTAEKAKLQAAFDATNASNDGILIRLQALSALSDRNATLGAAHWMLSLLFMCIELLPVLMKVLLNFGPATAYDKVTALRDAGDAEIEELEQQGRVTVEKARIELLVIAERERVEKQKEQVLARARAASVEREERRIRAERAAQRRLAALVDEENVAEEVVEDSGRRPWDTGPIFRAALRTVRSITGRSEDRVAV